ncbi:MAG: hypothetical protein Q4P15_08670 [Propionibacteriaceae bacterium]|nr:hypothetical protein [Propionibacteriaceae bacterium]
MKARPTIILAVVAALVVVLAVVAAVVSANRERPTLDPSTPEGVVQLFITALFDDDVEAAVTYLDPALGCSDPQQEIYLGDASRVAVLKTETTGDTARVELRIEEGSGFGGSYSHDESFALHREGDTWLISEEVWPLYGCKDE